MISKRILGFLLVATVAVPVIPAMTVPSHAQVSLQDWLFNRNARREKRRERLLQEQQAERRVPRKPIARISGPRYYNYAATPLATVTLASLLPDLAAEGGLEPTLDLEARRFTEALRLAPDESIAMRKDVAEAIKARYADHPQFIWSRGNSVTSAAKAVIALMDMADDHALEASQYRVALPADGWSMDNPAGRTARLLEFDIMLSARAMRYAMDMKDGVVMPDKLSGYHDFPDHRMTPAEAIEGLAGAADPVKWLKSLEPRQPAYAALKKELATLRAMDVEEIVIPEGTFVKQGQTDPAVPLIMKALRKKVTPEAREKHAATFAEYLGGEEFTFDIVELVKDFQRDNGLVPDGIVGKNTIKHLSDFGPGAKIERVELALERLRWHPETFGPRNVVINQPAFRATYSENGEDTLSMRAIVGKKTNQTSFFYDEVETVVYKPYWGVPQSIIVNEMLPRLYNDPGYLDRTGYEVTNVSGKRVSSSSVNWWQYSGKVPYNVRQKPGPSNALGDVKILFPNKHDIYMHDTPSRNLFSRDMRALSHGCVRLQQPREMAAAVLGKSVDYVSSRIEAGGGEEQERVPVKIPVFVSYYTAWPTAAGDVEYFDDIYDRDMYLRRAIDAVHKSRAGAES